MAMSRVGQLAGTLKEASMTLSIRPAEARDAAALAEIYAPSVLHRPTSFELRARCRRDGCAAWPG